jgi:osmoprotectant transport system substrate-binding protein
VRRLLKVLPLVLALSMIAAACGDDDDGGGQAPDDAPSITIGAQDFGESAILAEIYKQGLEAKGYDVDIQELGGFRDLEIEAFDDGTINFAPEYAASLLEFLNKKKGEATADVDETVDALEGYLEDIDLVALDASDAVDTNAFVVTEETAEDLDLKTLSDLAKRGDDLTLGGPADCPTNPFCIPGLEEVYGLDLSDNFESLEIGQIADALDAEEIDIALLFSTDGRIAANNYVLLEDDKQMLAADNILPIVSNELSDVDELVDAINEITEALTTEKLIELNERFDVDKEDAADIARDFLEDEDLI